MKINLHIDQLMLHGIQLTAADRALVSAAVQSESERLLALAGSSHTWVGLGDHAYLPGGKIPYQPGNNPEILGMRIARALYGGLQQ